MPTHDEEPEFLRDWATLTNEQHERFLNAVKKLVHDARAGGPYRRSLRIKHVQGHAGVYEMTWGDDGRATFEFGQSPHAGDVHVIWRRVGNHGHHSETIAVRGALPSVPTCRRPEPLNLISSAVGGMTDSEGTRG